MSRLSALQVLSAVLDPGSYTSWDSPPREPDLGPVHIDQLARARERSGVDEAVITVDGLLDGRRVAVAAGEFGFLGGGGSIGSAASEHITAAIECATAECLPLLAPSSSGGTRTQEGTPVFLQMVKIGQAVIAHRRALLLVSLPDLTTGGVLASWGSLGHLTVAEPQALIGLLGPRVREVIHGEPFPEGVQRPSEVGTLHPDRSASCNPEPYAPSPTARTGAVLPRRL